MTASSTSAATPSTARRIVPDVQGSRRPSFSFAMIQSEEAQGYFAQHLRATAIVFGAWRQQGATRKALPLPKSFDLFWNTKFSTQRFLTLDDRAGYKAALLSAVLELLTDPRRADEAPAALTSLAASVETV